jgi:hypothetical protein
MLLMKNSFSPGASDTVCFVTSMQRGGHQVLIEGLPDHLKKELSRHLHGHQVIVEYFVAIAIAIAIAAGARASPARVPV